MQIINLKITHRSAFGLIEVMIAALILSVSLFGVAALQSRSLYTIVESGRNEAAYQMMSQLASYVSAFDTTSPSPQDIWYLAEASVSPSNANIGTCYSAGGCSQSVPSVISTKQAFYIATASEWQNILSTMLPNGQGCTCLTSFNAANVTTAQTSNLIIAINWKTISGAISTVSLTTQLPSAIIPAGTFTPCLNSGMQTPAMTSGPLGICNSSV